MQADAVSTRIRDVPPLLAGALACALVSTAHAEYTLATATHVNSWVALAVPGALDLYVIQALVVRRDVFLAVLVMVAANVTSHLITAGVLPVHWSVVASVGALAPLIVWRVHSLERTRTRTELLLGVPAGTDPGAAWFKDRYADSVAAYLSGVRSGAVSAPAPENVPASHPCDLVAPYGCRFTDRCDGCGYAYGVHPMPDVPAPVPAWAPGFHLDGCDGLCSGAGADDCTRRASALDVPVPGYDPDPVYVPEDWKEVHLRAVPDLPPDVPGFDPAAALHSPVLEDSDWAYLADASEYVHSCKDMKRTPSVRGLRLSLNVGQDRAVRLLEHLGERRKR